MPWLRPPLKPSIFSTFDLALKPRTERSCWRTSSPAASNSPENLISPPASGPEMKTLSEPRLGFLRVTFSKPVPRNNFSAGRFLYTVLLLATLLPATGDESGEALVIAVMAVEGERETALRDSVPSCGTTGTRPLSKHGIGFPSGCAAAAPTSAGGLPSAAVACGFPFPMGGLVATMDGIRTSLFREARGLTLGGAS